MPFYEYECSNCRYYAEVLQKISDTALKKCPSCGKSTFKKLISAPVFRLKGSGWYETDFKGDKDHKRNLAGADKDEGAPKTEPKPSDTAKTETPKSEAAPKTEAVTKSEAKPATDSTKASKSASKSRARAKPVARAPAKRASPTRAQAPKRRGR